MIVETPIISQRNFNCSTKHITNFLGIQFKVSNSILIACKIKSMFSSVNKVYDP